VNFLPDLSIEVPSLPSRQNVAISSLNNNLAAMNLHLGNSQISRISAWDRSTTLSAFRQRAAPMLITDRMVKSKDTDRSPASIFTTRDYLMRKNLEQPTFPPTGAV
jgi:hypothetical protein